MTYSLFNHVDRDELAGAIARLAHHIEDLKHRRNALRSSHSEPWAYRSANRMTGILAAKLDREIRDEKRTLRDMRRALNTQSSVDAVKSIHPDFTDEDIGNYITT